MQPEAVLEKGLAGPSRGALILGLVLLNVLLVFCGPFIFLKKLYRTSRRKNRHELDWRRWFIAPIRPEVPIAPLGGPRVVLIGPTFGELRMMESITRQLKTIRPDTNIIWCLRDPATFELIKASHPDQAFVVWPLDNAFPVLKWVRRIRPDAIVIVEKFWLPNLLGICKLAGAKIAVINGRTNRRDTSRDKIKLAYYRWIGQNVDLICLQSNEFQNRLMGLLRPNAETVVTGNLKLDLEVPPLGEGRLAGIKSWLDSRGGRALLAAGSTADDADEEFVFSAFAKARGLAPCSLLIAPRRLARVPRTVQAAKSRGLVVSCRTAPLAVPADVYVLDTLGELSSSYQFAKAAFIGGTIEGTGHNVVEPVLWGEPVSYGPRRGHFEDLQQLCEGFGVGFRCMASNDLAEHWSRVLTDKAFLDQVRENAKRFLTEERGATQKTVEALLTLIPESAIG